MFKQHCKHCGKDFEPSTAISEFCCMECEGEYYTTLYNNTLPDKSNHIKKVYMCMGNNGQCNFYESERFILEECKFCKCGICTSEEAIKDFELKNGD